MKVKNIGLRKPLKPREFTLIVRNLKTNLKGRKMNLIKDNVLDRYTDGRGNWFTISKIFIEKEQTKDGFRFTLKQYYQKDTKDVVLRPADNIRE